MYECESHKLGHRTEEARNACVKKAERRAQREAKKAEDIARREANLERESVSDYIKRRFCVEGVRPQNVAVSLQREYPPRADGKKWSWVHVVQEHAENHIKWPEPGQFTEFLNNNPDVMLPSELRHKAGVSREEGMVRD